MPRADGRGPDELRRLKITRNFVSSAAGSCLIEFGRTRVIVTATVQDQVPPFLLNTGLGWVSAEYGMLPGSTQDRKQRDGRRGGNIDGRTMEIQRLIGRAFRTVIDQRALGQRTIWIDCDVIEADGGTRTTSINGAYIALYDAFKLLRDRRVIQRDPMRTGIAAVSVGIVDGKPLLDLDYQEDSSAESDFNFVFTHEGEIVEVQGTAEKRPISRQRFDECWVLAEKGIKQIVSRQNTVLITS